MKSLKSFFMSILFVLCLMGTSYAASAGYSVSNLVELDTHASIVIDYPHHEIHAGDAFSGYYTLTTAATNGHRSAIYLKTPPTKEVHMVVSFGASTAAIFSMCEGVTIDVNEGTSATLYNRNRNSTNLSTVLDNATVPLANKFTTFTEAQLAAANLNTGTILRTEPLVVGDGPKPAGGVSRGTQEYILKVDTKYLFLLTNTAASANKHHILIDWYEHTFKGRPLQ